MYIYQNVNDLSKIEYVSKETHRIKIDSKGKATKVKLEEDLLIFKYIEAAELKHIKSQSKLGKTIDFKRSDFESLVNQKMFIRLS